MQVNKGSNGRKRTIGTSVCCAALSVSLVAGLSPLPSFAAHTADAATSAQSSTNAAKVTIPSTVLDLQKKVNELWISEDGKDVPMQFNGASRATTWVTPAIMNQAQHLLVQAYTELFTSSTHQLSSSTTSQIESFYKTIKDSYGGIVKPGADIKNTPESETINFVLHSYDSPSAIKTLAKSFALSFVNTANKRQRFTTIKTDPKNRQLECLVVLPKKPASYKVHVQPGYYVYEEDANYTPHYNPVVSYPLATKKYVIGQGVVALFDVGEHGSTIDMCTTTIQPQTAVSQSEIPQVSAHESWKFDGWQIKGSDKIYTNEEVAKQRLTQATLFTAHYTKAGSTPSVSTTPTLNFSGNVADAKVGNKLTAELSYTLDNAKGYSVSANSASLEGEGKDGLTVTVDIANKKVKITGTPTKAGDVTVKLSAAKTGSAALEKQVTFKVAASSNPSQPLVPQPEPGEQHPAAAVQYKALPTNILDLQRLVDYTYVSVDGNDVPAAFNNIGTSQPKDILFANDSIVGKINKQLVYVDQATKNKLKQELFNAYKKFYIEQSSDITLTDASTVDVKPGKQAKCDAIDVNNLKLKFSNYDTKEALQQRKEKEYFALFDAHDAHNVMYPIAGKYGYFPFNSKKSAQATFQVRKSDNAEYHLKAMPGFAFVDVIAGKRTTLQYPKVDLKNQSGNLSPSLTTKQEFTVEPGFVALFDCGTNGVIETGDCVQTYAPQTTLDYAPAVKAKDGYTFKGWKAQDSDKVLSSEDIKATQLTKHTLFTAVYEQAAVPKPALKISGEVSGAQAGKELSAELTYTLDNADGYSVEASVEGDAKDGLTATADTAAKKVKLSGTPTKAGEVKVKLRATKEGKTPLEQTKTFSVAPAAPAPVLILTGDVSGIQVGKEVTSELTYTLDNADGYSVEASVEGDAKDGLTATADTAAKKVKLSGTPTKAGEVKVKLRATKEGKTPLEQTKTFSVAPAPAPEPPAPAPSPSPLPEKKDKPKEETPAPSFEQATKRIAGNTAEDTMQQIVQTAFPDPVKEVVLATSESYWDALSANSLAGSLNAPVLLTHHNQLPEQTIAELKRLQTSKVVVCGGENAISNDVVSQLKALNIEVERIAGTMASDTANDIAKKLDASDTAVVTTSWGYEDALSAASFAYAKKAPIFLADYNTATLDASNIQTMKDKGVKKVYIVGGTSVVSSEVEAQLSAAGITFERVAGKTAYDTSAQLATKLISLGMSANNMAIATGWGYTDALAGAALCGKQNSVMVLADNTNQTAISEVVAANKQSIKNYYIFGGTSAVGEGATDALKGVFTDKDANKDANKDATSEQATNKDARQ